MTDKVQKIREEVEKLKSQLLRGACSSQIAMETRCKEEAYNEALAIFDSLQEEPVSEDERIRKELICFLESEIVQCAARDKYIAWLEKQGGHVKFINRIQVGDKVTRNEDGVLVNMSQLKRVAKPAEEYNITGIGSKHAEGKLDEMIKKKLEMEKQNEQKPAELPKGEDYGIDGLYAAINILQKTLGDVDGYQSDDGILEHKCAIEAVNRLYKQKPAWSEDDEKCLENAIMYCEWARDKAPDFYCYDTSEKSINFLKSLKNRVQPQNTWKPTEEQMSALFYVIEDVPKSVHINICLNSLYEQLKKLKEE